MLARILEFACRWLAVKDDINLFKGSEWSDTKEEGKWKEERGKTGPCQFIKRRREERVVRASLLRGGERKDWSVSVY